MGGGSWRPTRSKMKYSGASANTPNAPAPQKTTFATKGGEPPSDAPKPIVGIFREAGGDAETLQALRPYNTMGLMSGIAAANPAQFPGYREEIGRASSMR